MGVAVKTTDNEGDIAVKCGFRKLGHKDGEEGAGVEFEDLGVVDDFDDLTVEVEFENESEENVAEEYDVV